MELYQSGPSQNIPIFHSSFRSAISMAGKLLAFTLYLESSSTLVGVWDLDSHEWVREFIVDFQVITLGFLRNGKCLALAGRNSLETWNAETGSRLQTLRSPDEPSVCFTSLAIATPADLNGDLIASGSDNGAVRLWDAATGNCTGSTRIFGQSVSALEFSQDGQQLAAGLTNGRVRVWNSKGALVCELGDHDGKISSMAFFGDDQLVSASPDETVRIWDPKTGGRVKNLHYVEDAQVVSLGTVGFASGSVEEWQVKIWDSRGELVQMLGNCDELVGHLAFCAEKQFLACNTVTGIVIWDLKEFLPAYRISAHRQQIHSIRFSSDGLLLASGSNDSIKIWDTTDCTCICSIDCTEEGGERLAFSPDSRHLVSRKAAWLKASPLTVWDAGNGKAVKTFPYATDLEAFSPNGGLFALALFAPIVAIWDLNASKEHGWIPRCATCLVFSADGHTLALASDRNLEIWDMSNDACIWSVAHWQSTVTSLALSAKTQLLAAGMGLGSVQVWDVSHRTLRITVPTDGESVSGVAFSPNQELLAWADEEGIRIRNLEDGGGAHLLWSEGFRCEGRTSLQFNQADSSRLCTPMGDLDTSKIRDGRIDFYGCHLDESTEWISRGQEKVVLLPQEYQRNRAGAVFGQAVAIGNRRGEVSLFRF